MTEFSQHITLTPTINLSSKLTVQTFDGVEAVNEPFVYRAQFTSTAPPKEVKQLLGQSADVELNYPQQIQRCFNGIISQLECLGERDNTVYVYALQLTPWLSELARENDYRLFCNKSAVDVFTSICRQHGYTDIRLAVKQSPVNYDVIIQYGQHTLEFLQQLLNREGLFYYFEHHHGKHTVVLCDELQQAVPQLLHFAGNKTHCYGIQQWRRHGGLFANQFDCVDYSLQTPNQLLQAESGFHDIAETLMHQSYPADAQDAQAVARRAKQQSQHLQAVNHYIEMGGNSAEFLLGQTLCLQAHPTIDEACCFTPLRLEHHAINNSTITHGEEPSYNNQGIVLSTDFTYAPAYNTEQTPLTTTLSATVVAADSKEMVDATLAGHVQVCFDFQTGEKQVGLWLPLLQWQASSFGGTQFIPRVGDRVEVAFIDGHATKPVIVGAHYQKTQPSPLVNAQPVTHFGGMQASILPGDNKQHYHRLSFDDTPGAEQLTLKSAYDIKQIVVDSEQHQIDDDSLHSIKQTYAVDIKGQWQLQAKQMIYSVGSNSVVIDASGVHLHTGSGKVQLIENGQGPERAAARLLDTTQCHKVEGLLVHSTGRLCKGSGALIINQQPAATVHSKIHCYLETDKVKTSEFSHIFINGKNPAHLKSATKHGAHINKGSHNVVFAKQAAPAALTLPKNPLLEKSTTSKDNQQESADAV